MSSASTIFGTKAYVCARYFLRPGKCFKYIGQHGEDVTEHVYEAMALYPYYVLYYSNIVLDSQRIAKAADSTNTVQNVFEACHVTGA